MKIKIFPLMDINNLEYEVNDFMKDKIINKVETISSGSGNIDDGFTFTQNLIVLYDEREDD